MSYADQMLTCQDCGTTFTFTAGEQEFYAQKGFVNSPTRCPSCRQQRKSANGRSGGERYSSRDQSGGGADSREMHSATCASCGKEALVPFVPRGDKPVYCSDCFQQQRRANNRY
jgi:CxxC-x17-CxxC domain-containing protein